MKVPYIVLSLGASALFLWQCSQMLNQNSKTLMHSILNDYRNTSSFSNQVDQALVHDKKYGYFLQITDTHLDDHYTEGATLKSGCHAIPNKHMHSKHKQLCNVMGVPGVRMDAPSILIEHTLDWIKREWRDKLDFVIWTGDNSRHDWDKAHPRKETKVLELNRQVTQMMSDLFCSSPEHPRAIPVVPVIGNNDVQPHNYIQLNDDVLYFFEKLWDHWIPKKQRKDFLEGGYFAVDVAPGLRVLSINTMFFLKKNPLAKSCSKKSSSGHHHMKWYKNQLRKARRDNVKVYVVGHVPPSPRDFFKSCMTDYMSITADFSDVVYGHFYGHLNMDHFLLYDKREQEIHNSEELQLPYLEDSTEEQHDTVSIQRNVREYVDWLKGMYDEIDEFENKHPDRHDLFHHQKPIMHKKPKNFDPEPVVVVHIAPSVFPVYMPSVRIYRYEYRNSPEQGATHTYGTLLGYSQFVANISRYNEEDGHKDPKPPLNFDLEYDTKTLYGLSDLSVDAYIEFADALTQNDTEINRAAVQDCAVSTGVQASISNLNLANDQVLTAVGTINNYNKTEPYPHMIYIARSGMILTQHLTSATTSCCAITTPVSKEESIAVLGVVGSVIPRTEAMYSALAAIKPEMYLNLLVPLAILNAVTNGFAVLDSYLVALAPAEDAATINTYINRISIAFKAAFGIAYAYYYYYCYQAHLFE